MNRVPVKRMLIFALITVVALCVPTSLAKYYANNSLTLNVKYYKVPNPTIRYISGSSASATEYRITKTGRYAIVAKGGDGGNGVCVNGNHVTQSIPGGTGGIISITVDLQEGQYLECYTGNKGGNAGVSTPGSAATVASIGSGGKGSNSPGTFIGDTLTKAFSSDAASAGGGSATSIFVESSSKSNYSPNYTNLLLVAAGGGGAGGWDQSYAYPNRDWGFLYFHTFPAGIGGVGGSNVLDTTDTDTPSNNSGTVYVGGNGRIGSLLPQDYTYTSGKSTKEITGGDRDGKNKGVYVYRYSPSVRTYGLGGNATSGGDGAPLLSYHSVLNSHKGENGSNFANNGTGGSTSYSYGGAGGGGYCGGGAGSGASLDYSAGGGGGGSSFFANKYNASTYSSYESVLFDDELPLKISVKRTDYDPQYNSDYTKSNLVDGDSYNMPNYSTYTLYKEESDGDSVLGGGFIIIKYLGPIS